MRISPAAKYGFRIRTRSGAVVGRLMIFGKDAADAERKLRQIYVGCEILEARAPLSQPPPGGPATYEDVVDLLADPAARARSLAVA